MPRRQSPKKPSEYLSINSCYVVIAFVFELICIKGREEGGQNPSCLKLYFLGGLVILKITTIIIFYLNFILSFHLIL